MNIASTNSSDSFEQIARFQSLQSGQYWSSNQAIPTEAITANMTLLIESIRYVDDQPHTIVLRSHPSIWDRYVEIEVPQEDGTVRSRETKFKTHRFLTKDFLAKFTFQPDHQQIRNAEVQEAHQLINKLQQELISTQSDPEKMMLAIEADIKHKNEANGSTSTALATQDSQSDSVAVTVATGTVADALAGGLSEAGIDQLKVAASRAHELATVKANWIRTKTSAIAEAIQAVTPFYAEQAAAALATTEDTRTYVEKLLKGIESLDLYVGKDVEVLTVCEGAPAPDGMPLTLVQQKRVMDEELAVWLDLDQWFDFSRADLFYDALRKHPGLIDQIFPAQRCVLVMCTTRRWIDYGDTWTNNVRNDANRVVFLMVRNGENVHVVWSGVESHLKTDRLFPSAAEQQRQFRGMDGSTIKFEDVAYTDRLADHDRMALHYKRFLLLLCGLDHRLKLFGEFYDEPQSMNFVSLDFQAKHFNFIHDDETLCLPGEERPSVYAWQQAMNALIQPGSRLLCTWGLMLNPDSAPAAVKNDGRHTEHRYRPVKSDGVAIVAQDGQDLIVRCDVKGYSYSSHQDREFSCRVNLAKITGTRWDLDETSHLCLDAVKPEDLHYYIHNRAARRNHVSYIRFFKKALRLVTAERFAEEGTRKALLAAMAEGNIANETDREALIDKAVIAWRAKNRGKDLPRVQEGIAPATWKSLLDQLYLLAGDGAARLASIEKYVRESGRVPLRLTITGKAALTVYVAPFDSECDNRVQQHPWVHCIVLTPTKGGYTEKSRSWALLPTNAVKESIVHQWPEADKWVGRTSAFKSYSAKQTMLRDLTKQAEQITTFGTKLSAPDLSMYLQRWSSLRYEWTGSKKLIVKPAFYLPLGLVVVNEGKSLQLLCLVAQDPEQLLGRLAPTPADAAKVLMKTVSILKDPSRTTANFKRSLTDRQFKGWTIATASIDLLTSNIAPFARGSEFSGIRDGGVDPLLSTVINKWMSDPTALTRKWLAPNVWTASEGGSLLDAALGISRGEDYAPCRLKMLAMVQNPDAPADWLPWIDLCPGQPEEGFPRLHSEDPEQNSLIDAEFYKGNHGLHSYQMKYASPSDARRALVEFGSRHNSEEGPFDFVPAAELPHMPQPPAGYERWYRMKKA